MKTLALTLCLLALPVSAQANNPKVELDTNKGKIVVELYPDKAPETVKNFLAYVKKKHYDGLIFHRVIAGFMIQGGGFDKDFKQRPTDKPIKLEAGVSNTRGTLAMARTSVPDSATSQFFINLVDNNRLDTHGGGYAVFGKVVGDDGMKIVDEIAKSKVAPHGIHRHAPVEPVVINTVTELK